MTEERVLGGTCVNRGCLPSKNLIEAARLVHDAAHPRYPGLSPAALGVDFGALVRQKDELVDRYRDEKYKSLLGARFDVVEGHAELVDPHTVQVGSERLVGDKLLIATGSRPVLPEIDGLADVPYLTSDLLSSGEAVELRELPRSLLVVGGGYVALELGQMFHRFGSEVTLLERSDGILAHGYEPEVGPALADALQVEGVRILTRARVRSVRVDGKEVVAAVEIGGQLSELRAERVLVATGRRPNSDGIAIERSGVRLGPGGEVEVDEQLQTNVPHIFAAGDVIGREVQNQMATPVGSQDGGIAAHNALTDENPRTVSHRVVPRAIFTDPQVAVVGMTEQQAVAAGYPCWCRALPLSIVPRAGAIRDTRGMVKMVANAKTDEVLGISMVGTGAAEVIHEAAMALRFRAKLRDFIDLLHVYPTMAEALKIAAISRFKDPARLSCCAD